MTVTVAWEAFLGFNGHAEPSYAAPVTLSCWQEAHPPGEGGMVADRAADGTVVEPKWDLYFDGDDANVRSFKLYDRFTPGGIATSSAQKLQAVHISTIYGPPFDNTTPWMVLVTL